MSLALLAGCYSQIPKAQRDCGSQVIEDLPHKILFCPLNLGPRMKLFLEGGLSGLNLYTDAEKKYIFVI